ncbi:zf-HC2 domain-containing protein [Streptomyces sp. AV19]|uniref:anti-sigma factor family protein n=1 Tax=Streptomyces sp. AV19 TaxID=2793068 RepID=UPI0018FEBC70|nr:zf-HC2 domain-containing protein [Streptomyces sp. AV19]MBH1935662.1 zf-HC2 domain-containing protein [Streptomyces sp. AV19]
MSGSGGQSPAEQHLGDRLAALVDGELGHESRERVLAHLATCGKCKAEADAQRRLKSVFAEAPPPPLSEALLARLQALPGVGMDGPAGPGASAADGDGDEGRTRWRGGLDPRADAFALVPLAGLTPREHGFRIHEMGRGASRGRRFGIAAAGAVTIAAFALVGAQPLGSVEEVPRARAEDPRVSTTALALGSSQGGGTARDAVVHRPSPAVPPALPVAVPFRMPLQTPLSR